MPRTILRDDQWQRIEHLLPGKASDPGVTAQDNRLFVEAVLWIARTGAPWRDLPPSLGDWHNVFTRYSRWGKKGVWQRLIEALIDDPDLEALLIDSTVVRAHQHAAGAQKKQDRKRSGARAAG
jgi:transposase